MYKIIGADQKEYGPVTPEQLRQWITEGRASLQTKVLPEGETEWKAFSAVCTLAEIRSLTAEMLEAQRAYLPQFAGRTLKPVPPIVVPNRSPLACSRSPATADHQTGTRRPMRRSAAPCPWR